MTKQINWVSLARKIIDKQDSKLSSDAKTIRYIQSYIDTLLDKGSLTEKQSAGLIRNIDIHLGVSIPAQIVKIGRTTAWKWKKQGVAAAPKPVQPLTAEDHWQALLGHYGSLEAVAHAAVDRLEGNAQPASTPTGPAPKDAAQKPLDRNQQVTVSIWEGSGFGSGNLDYKDGSKEHVVFHAPLEAKKKLEKAGAPDSLWRSLQIALDGMDDCDIQLGIVHGEKDPKGKKTPSNNDCIVVKATPRSNPAKKSVTFVQSARPITALAGTDNWTKRKSAHPDIKGFVEGLVA
ncbi:hypothetical protein [Sphingobium chungangianum]